MSKEVNFENIYAHDRQPLHKVVPLDTPFAVNIESSSYCNIRCSYCVHSSPESMAALGFAGNYSGGFMSEETFQLILDQLCEFPKKIKCITFGGIGEPLLHKDLPKMIAQVKERNITERIHLITNGITLTEEKADAIIRAGLGSMKISLQGIDAQAYYDICGYHLDFKRFLKNIDYLYQHKGDCVIGIKIADIALYRGKNEDKKLQAEEQYKKLFGDKCDKLGIERIIPAFPTVDYSKVDVLSGHGSRYNITERNAKVCSRLFFHVNVLQNGSVTLCCCMGLHEEWMNVHNRTLKEIWDSDARKRKMIKALRDIQDDEMKVCQNCAIKNDIAFEEDNLDPYVDEILSRMADCK